MPGGYKSYYNKSKKISRNVYKKTGLVNPVKKGKLSLTRVLKDVNMIKGMLNTEKKRVYQTQTSPQTVGQINFNTSGHFLLDITPQPAQGVGFDQKTGNSIKWTSSFMEFLFQGQSGMISGVKLKIQIVKVVGLPFATLTNVMGQFVQNNFFINNGVVYDITSSRDPDFFKNFRVLKTKYVYMAPDSISGEPNIKNVKIGLKNLERHVRTDNNSATISEGQVFLLITADRGNTSAASASTLNNVSISAVSTGVSFNYNFTHYYVDN